MCVPEKLCAWESSVVCLLLYTRPRRWGSSRRFCALAAAGFFILVLILFAPVGSQAQTPLGTQTLSLTLNAAGLLYGFPNTLTLIKAGTVFDSYAGSLSVQYRARTSSSGSGTITVKATTDFPCALGGPCIAIPPSAGDQLSYTCSGATLGTNCSGSQTVSTVAATNVVTAIPASACTGGGSPCSTANPNTVIVNFNLTDDPKYKTGPYSAILTFTISAT